MFFDRRCPVCGVTERRLCASCAAGLQRGPELHIDGFDEVIALLAYDDRSARLVLAGKNGGRRDLLRWSGELLAADIMRRFDVGELDLVTWVPAHPAQRRTRGFDQGEVLARAIARRLGRPCRRTLSRRGGTSRKGLGRAARLDGPLVRTTRRIPGTVLLIDDVVATGSTLGRCAEALHRGGAERIIAGVVAASGGSLQPLRAPGSPTIYIDSPSGVRPEAT